nr:hypothetical protein [uncultured Lachnoclostridium sp.]
MKKIYLLLLMLVVAIGSVAAKGDKIPDYDIIGAGSGNEGMVLVKVFVYSKSSSDQDLKRAAVHGVVFRGCTGNNSGSKQPAMASSDAESSHAAFCKDFFADDGECQNYASIIAGSYERVKTSKGYKNGAIVQVDKRALRKALEKAGVVRSLSSGF